MSLLTKLNPFKKTARQVEQVVDIVEQAVEVVEEVVVPPEPEPLKPGELGTLDAVIYAKAIRDAADVDLDIARTALKAARQAHAKRSKSIIGDN